MPSKLFVACNKSLKVFPVRKSTGLVISNRPKAMNLVQLILVLYTIKYMV